VKFKKLLNFIGKKGLKGCYRFIKCSLRKLGKKILSRKCVIIRRSCSIKKKEDIVTGWIENLGAE